jgi:hypothetical protein
MVAIPAAHSITRNYSFTKIESQTNELQALFSNSQTQLHQEKRLAGCVPL